MLSASCMLSVGFFFFSNQQFKWECTVSSHNIKMIHFKFSKRFHIDMFTYPLEKYQHGWLWQQLTLYIITEDVCQEWVCHKGVTESQRVEQSATDQTTSVVCMGKILNQWVSGQKNSYGHLKPLQKQNGSITKSECRSNLIATLLREELHEIMGFQECDSV